MQITLLLLPHFVLQRLNHCAPAFPSSFGKSASFHISLTSFDNLLCIARASCLNIIESFLHFNYWATCAKSCSKAKPKPSALVRFSAPPLPRIEPPLRIPPIAARLASFMQSPNSSAALPRSARSLPLGKISTPASPVWGFALANPLAALAS